MRRLNPFRHQRRNLTFHAICAAVFVLSASPSFAQSPGAAQAAAPWSKELEKYPGLLPELAKLAGKLQQDVQFPASRSESRLLPLLPESTAYYAALPNYGDSAQQALAIFRQELKDSTVLHDWWTHGDLATSGPKIEEAIEKFGQLHQFLGNEIVFSGSMDAEHKSGTFVAFAEIRKPGLDKFIEQEIAEAGGASKVGVQVFDQEGLDKVVAILSKDLLVLVRSDFVIATTDLATLRSFNASLKPGAAGRFAATPFGQKIAQEYQGGATVLAAADLRNILKQVASGPSRDRHEKRSRNLSSQRLRGHELHCLEAHHGWRASRQPGRTQLQRSAAWRRCLARQACASRQLGFCVSRCKFCDHRRSHEPATNI